MATHSSILAWRIPGTVGPGGLPSLGRSESDTTEATQQQQQQYFFRLNYYCYYQLIQVTKFCMWTFQQLQSRRQDTAPMALFCIQIKCVSLSICSIVNFLCNFSNIYCILPMFFCHSKSIWSLTFLLVIFISQFKYEQVTNSVLIYVRNIKKFF